MRHKKSKFQLNRFTSWRKATLKSIARNIILYQSIRTSPQKAKAARPLVEKLVALAKTNTVGARRRAFEILGSHSLVSLLFKEIGPRFANRNSGFIRIINLGVRRGDGASTAVFELSEIKKKEVKKPKKEAKKDEGQKTEKPVEGLAHEEAKPKTETALKEERHPETKKPAKKFMGGIRNIFKKERDSL